MNWLVLIGGQHKNGPAPSRVDENQAAESRQGVVVDAGGDESLSDLVRPLLVVLGVVLPDKAPVPIVGRAQILAAVGAGDRGLALNGTRRDIDIGGANGTGPGGSVHPQISTSVMPSVQLSRMFW